VSVVSSANSRPIDNIQWRLQPDASEGDRGQVVVGSSSGFRGGGTGVRPLDFGRLVSIVLMCYDVTVIFNS